MAFDFSKGITGEELAKTQDAGSFDFSKGSTGFDDSKAALAQSQNTLDTLKTKAAEAKKVADYENSLAGTLAGTARGTGKTVAQGLLGGGVKAGRTALSGIADLFGFDPHYTDTYTNFEGKPEMTHKGEVMTGQKTPGEATLGFALDAASIPIVGTAVGRVGSEIAQGAKPLIKKAAESKLLSPAVKFAEETVGPAISKGVSKLTSPITNYLTQRAEKKAVAETIDAVYHSPTGKKFTSASSKVLSGERKVTPASLFREQGLTPDEQTVNLATRLKKLGLGKNPVKNTEKLADEFASTEARLQRELAANPGTLADKPKLSQAIKDVKTNAPQEFRVKDSQAMVNKVADFSQKVIGEADDSINGVREARKAFDAQTKREFPNAFKPDGTIDTKTPAGYAIKTVRDTINEHLYNIAPNGSEIQGLIGHEADLYRAAQVSMQKALAGEGKTGLQQWIKNNPAKVKVLTAAGLLGAGGVGGEILRGD